MLSKNISDLSITYLLSLFTEGKTTNVFQLLQYSPLTDIKKFIIMNAENLHHLPTYIFF